MTFAELLKASSDASLTLAHAANNLASARAALEATVAANDAAESTLASANQALHDLLAERGVHWIAAPDGTLTTYHAIDGPPGWCSQHPIPGEMPPGVTQVSELSASSKGKK